MADVPVLDIVLALAEALRGVTVANGYNTDLGLDVHTETSEKKLTAPRATVWCSGKERADSGERSPGIGRAVEGWIEVAVPADFEQALEYLYKADADIDRLLSACQLMPGALPAQYEEVRISDRPDGMPIALAQVRWSTAFRYRSGS